jgi:hypothetical protein
MICPARELNTEPYILPEKVSGPGKTLLPGGQLRHSRAWQ